MPSSVFCALIEGAKCSTNSNSISIVHELDKIAFYHRREGIAALPGQSTGQSNEMLSWRDPRQGNRLIAELRHVFLQKSYFNSKTVLFIEKHFEKKENKKGKNSRARTPSERKFITSITSSF
jgi:hypothetical protein|tara:strand:- start:429 stop:794 length:366 start_codon:yes stop_codon:yes gene_type:complete